MAWESLGPKRAAERQKPVLIRPRLLALFAEAERSREAAQVCEKWRQRAEKRLRCAKKVASLAAVWAFGPRGRRRRDRLREGNRPEGALSRLGDPLLGRFGVLWRAFRAPLEVGKLLVC